MKWCVGILCFSYIKCRSYANIIPFYVKTWAFKDFIILRGPGTNPPWILRDNCLYIIICNVNIYVFSLVMRIFWQYLWKGLYNKLNWNILFCCRSAVSCSHGFEARWGTLALGNSGSGWQCSCFLFPVLWLSGISQVSVQATSFPVTKC